MREIIESKFYKACKSSIIGWLKYILFLITLYLITSCGCKKASIEYHTKELIEVKDTTVLIKLKEKTDTVTYFVGDRLEIPKLSYLYNDYSFSFASISPSGYFGHSLHTRKTEMPIKVQYINRTLETEKREVIVKKDLKSLVLTALISFFAGFLSFLVSRYELKKLISL